MPSRGSPELDTRRTRWQARCRRRGDDESERCSVESCDLVANRIGSRLPPEHRGGGPLTGERTDQVCNRPPQLVRKRDLSPRIQLDDVVRHQLPQLRLIVRRNNVVSLMR
jgi:hypothetical protein